MTTTLDDAMYAFAPLVDPKTGLIRNVDLVRLRPDDPRVFVAHAEPCDTSPLAGVRAANRGAAASVVQERAVVRACGEAVERYCSAFFRLDTFPLATEAELAAAGVPFISVTDVYPFAARQYVPDFPFDAPGSRSMRWVPARSWGDAGTTWVPASCVFVPYTFDRDLEPFTHMPISTGLAAGPSVEACVEKGILEILERDALMVVWHNRLPCPRVDVDSCRGRDPVVDRTLDAAASAATRWHLNLLTLDIPVPVICAALIDEHGPPMTSLGIAAHPDPIHALLLALEEALLTRVLLRQSAEIADSVPTPEATTLRGHLLAHATSPELRDALGFLVDDPPLLTLDEALQHRPGSADGCSGDVHEALRRNGFGALWVDLTTPDVADAGLAVARTLVPGLQPLDNDHRYRYLGGSRLRQVPQWLGRPDPGEDSFNPFPHPFP